MEGVEEFNDDQHQEVMEDGEIIDESSTGHRTENLITDNGTDILSSQPAFHKNVYNVEAKTHFTDLCEDEEDEAPEEILNRIAQQKSMEVEEQPSDPLVCHVCKSHPHKYRCPKCDVRSCSLDCIKKHKDQKNCDGVRPPFNPVGKLSDFDAQTSVRDQSWMAGIQNKMSQEHTVNVGQGGNSQFQVVDNSKPLMKHEDLIEESVSRQEDEEEQPRQFPQYINEDGTRNSANSAVERFLLPNAQRRRIFLSFSDDKGEDNSRHEQFSDSIFWCIDFIFRRQSADGNYSDYNYRVQNIPETIRICTILKQFLKPRKYGCIVSESDLDLEKMKPFIDAGIESLILLMRVPRYEKERYYVINPEKTMLDNTRNRVIVDHPKIIVILGTECFNMTTMSEDEAEDLRSRLQKERSSQYTQSGNRGGRGMGRGFRGGGNFRGGSRGNFRGRGSNSTYGNSNFPNKRYCETQGPQNDWKRGRADWRGGRGRGGNRRGNNEMDTFDPFEPFQGRNTLPSDYGMKTEHDERLNSMLSWENINKPGTAAKATSPKAYSNEYAPPETNTFGL